LIVTMMGDAVEMARWVFIFLYLLRSGDLFYLVIPILPLLFGLVRPSLDSILTSAPHFTEDVTLQKSTNWVTNSAKKYKSGCRCSPSPTSSYSGTRRM
jgi:cellulose synthase/poly-beta-1,6-N-acetylglucosamine synthase-like glycosyltransferase